MGRGPLWNCCKMSTASISSGSRTALLEQGESLKLPRCQTQLAPLRQTRICCSLTICVRAGDEGPIFEGTPMREDVDLEDTQVPTRHQPMSIRRRNAHEEA